MTNEMTNEEAIKELRDASDSEVRYGDTEHHYNEVMKRVEAFEMAIKALEQQPNRCDSCVHSEEQDGSNCYECVKGMTDNFETQPTDADCISRESVYELLAKEDWADTVIGIKELPSVTPQPRWIPVSERLPEEQDCYLVTTKWKGSHSGNVYIETNMAVFREKPKEWDCKGVIAWMPLPQPYKAESED